MAASPPKRYGDWLVVAIGTHSTLASFIYLPSSDEANAHHKGTLIAVSAATALTSLVTTFARKFLPLIEEDIHESLTQVHSFGMEEDRREFQALTPGGRVFAVSDSMGRVMVVHTATFLVMCILKGYRSAEVAFLTADAHLIVYSPLSRGDTLEVWDIATGELHSVARVPPGVHLTGDGLAAVVHSRSALAVVAIQPKNNEEVESYFASPVFPPPASVMALSLGLFHCFFI
jgi:hypothetical protein